MSYVCTKDAPWREGMPTPVLHEDAREVGEQESGWPGGDLVTYECPHCRYRWQMELPQ